MNRTFLKGLALIFIGATIIEVLVIKAHGQNLTPFAKYMSFGCLAIIAYGGYFIYIHKREKKDQDSDV